MHWQQNAFFSAKNYLCIDEDVPNFVNMWVLREKCPNRVFSGSNVGKYGPEITPYLDTFHVVETTSRASRTKKPPQ